jgi:hypothetical protein
MWSAIKILFGVAATLFFSALLISLFVSYGPFGWVAALLLIGVIAIVCIYLRKHMQTTDQSLDLRRRVIKRRALWSWVWTLLGIAGLFGAARYTEPPVAVLLLVGFGVCLLVGIALRFSVHLQQMERKASRALEQVERESPTKKG